MIDNPSHDLSVGQSAKAAFEVQMAKIVSEFGPWYSSNIALPHGLTTMGYTVSGDNYRAKKLLQITSDYLGRPFDQIRVADLGCGEGLYALEFAQVGARVVGIEGRKEHVARAEFVRNALNLKNIEFVQDDVRNFSADKYGQFDVILCSGILYHLDHPFGARLLKEMKSSSDGICIIDTRVALGGRKKIEFDGRQYQGRVVREHNWFNSAAQKASNRGASLHNNKSFWFNRMSLANLMADIGFSSVAEVLVPVPFNTRGDRVTLVATSRNQILPKSHFDSDLTGKRWPK